MKMAERQIHVELLIGRQVLGITGKPLGRLEEIQVELKKGECLVSEYHIGTYAFLERLSAWVIGRTILKLFGVTRRIGGYRVPWDQLDLSDPYRPKLRCPATELRRLTG
jgi:sporulation protein YlmC with PRC-barrel domain